MEVNGADGRFAPQASGMLIGLAINDLIQFPGSS
jgi:hypothetical protein